MTLEQIEELQELLKKEHKKIVLSMLLDKMRSLTLQKKR